MLKSLFSLCKKPLYRCKMPLADSRGSLRLQQKAWIKRYACGLSIKGGDLGLADDCIELPLTYIRGLPKSRTTACVAWMLCETSGVTFIRVWADRSPCTDYSSKKHSSILSSLLAILLNQRERDLHILSLMTAVPHTEASKFNEFFMPIDFDTASAS